MNPLMTTGLDARVAGTALSVNVNKVALLRNQRPLAIPSVVGLSLVALDAGAHGITVHPRRTSATSAARTCSISPRRCARGPRWSSTSRATRSRT
jgi:hypothetical protein